MQRYACTVSLLIAAWLSTGIAAASDLSGDLTAANNPPIADAGSDQTMPRHVLVTLDGGGSSDPDGDAISYAWTLFAPPGSSATLSDPTSLYPSFMIDVHGDYLATLTVNDGSVSSATDSVTVSTFNAAPVADAGEDQVITYLGATVLLDGSTSYDEDGDALDYNWSIESSPAGSLALLSDDSSASPSFVADVNGDYVFGLTVTDQFGATSDPDLVVVSFNNVAPVAKITVDGTTVIAGYPVLLDASGSLDANGDPLSYRWSVVSKPWGSNAGLSSPNSGATVLSTDMVGEYVVSLVVSDGLVTAEPTTALVVTVGSLNTVIRALIDLSDEVNELECDAITNCNMKKTLSNKLSVVAKHLRKGEYPEAYDKLVFDIEPKMNGCATDGWPDQNDWIRECPYGQDMLRPSLRSLIDGLGTM